MVFTKENRSYFVKIRPKTEDFRIFIDGNPHHFLNFSFYDTLKIEEFSTFSHKKSQHFSIYDLGNPIISTFQHLKSQPFSQRFTSKTRKILNGQPDAPFEVFQIVNLFGNFFQNRTSQIKSLYKNTPLKKQV